jgi:hypothetical protein
MEGRKNGRKEGRKQGKKEIDESTQKSIWEIHSSKNQITWLCQVRYGQYIGGTTEL